VATNISSVQGPRPDTSSGVRLIAYDTPHGPANAVLVADPTQSHGPLGSFGAGGMTSVSGCPENSRLLSGSSPLGPIF
jgi:hypothetical protein